MKSYLYCRLGSQRTIPLLRTLVYLALPSHSRHCIYRLQNISVYRAVDLLQPAGHF
uniref:Uncharacterized protein n=1 Tax=Anguilla anguilla TaxID=7936 RepID=A0A0E9XR50_ANGAN